MTPSQFRSTAAWQKARARALRGASVCHICGGLLRRDLDPRHPQSPSVDHVRPLATLDLSTHADRMIALDPSNLRPCHLGCNSSRGARMPKRKVPTVWNLNDYALQVGDVAALDELLLRARGCARAGVRA